MVAYNVMTLFQITESDKYSSVAHMTLYTGTLVISGREIIIICCELMYVFVDKIILAAKLHTAMIL